MCTALLRLEDDIVEPTVRTIGEMVTAAMEQKMHTLLAGRDLEKETFECTAAERILLRDAPWDAYARDILNNARDCLCGLNVVPSGA